MTHVRFPRVPQSSSRSKNAKSNRSDSSLMILRARRLNLQVQGCRCNCTPGQCVLPHVCRYTSPLSLPLPARQRTASAEMILLRHGGFTLHFWYPRQNFGSGSPAGSILKSSRNCIEPVLTVCVCVLPGIHRCWGVWRERGERGLKEAGSTARTSYTRRAI